MAKKRRPHLPTLSSIVVGENRDGVAYSPRMASLGERIRFARRERGLTQKNVADHLGIERPNVTQWESDTTKPDRDRLPDLAALLGVSVEWLLTENGEPPRQGAAPIRTPSTVRRAENADTLHLGADDIPIKGTAVGGTDGEFYFNGETVGYARRLPGIARTANVFGVYIESVSMLPRYRPGELVYASPRTASIGDDIIIELAPMPGERNGPSYIKTLMKRTPTRLICEQYNPPETIEYDLRHVKAVYRIIPLAELAGF